MITADTGPRRFLDRLPAHSLYETSHLGVLASVAAFTESETWLDTVIDPRPSTLIDEP